MYKIVYPLTLVFATLTNPLVASQTVEHFSQETTYVVEVRFTEPLSDEAKIGLTKQYALLEGVLRVDWFDEQQICLTVNKKFTIKSIKPGVERFNLAIHSHYEVPVNQKSSCSKF